MTKLSGRLVLTIYKDEVLEKNKRKKKWKEKSFL